MASEKQINANRLNASKSTGPKTPKGKSTVGQNAIKHGLLTNQSTIPGESQVEFDLHRDELFEEFDPVGPTEKHYVGRVVILSWRLRRATRILTAVLVALSDKQNQKQKHLCDILTRLTPGSESGNHPDFDLGNLTIKDFANSKVIHNLQMQERRIENSLFKTIEELQRIQMIRKIDA